MTNFISKIGFDKFIFLVIVFIGYFIAKRKSMNTLFYLDELSKQEDEDEVNEDEVNEDEINDDRDNKENIEK